MPSNEHQRPSTPSPGVLDPEWEEALRRGQRAEGELGSVEAELAIVHLLRHARAPEPLHPSALDRIWADVDREVTPLPWWRRHFGWGGTAVAALAAAAILVVIWPESPADDGAETGPEIAEASSPAAALEQQFALLAPGARDDLAREIDARRTDLRHALLARVTTPEDSAGGAP